MNLTLQSIDHIYLLVFSYIDLVFDMQKNFKYLDELIHGGAKEIVLTSDIVLGEDEESDYPEGINLDVDGLVIDGNGHSIDACSKTRIFYNTAKDVTIKNIALKNAVVAIYNFYGVLSISDSELSDNTSNLAGAAIYNNWGELNINDSVLSDNASGCHGGAIFNVNGTVNVKSSRFCNNSAKGDGGAIYSGAKLNIEDSELSHNYAGGSGGAIYDNRGEINIAESVLSDNESKGIFGGGAIHKNRGNLDIVSSKLLNNWAKSDGGAIFSIDGNVSITESELSKNVSEACGGAICDGGTLNVESSDFSDNSSKNGDEDIFTK